MVAMVTKDTSTGSIAKNAIRYLVRQSQHSLPSIMQWDPKVSVLLWLERRRPAQCERHTKSNTSVLLRGGFFQVVEVVQKQRYFKWSSQLPTVNRPIASVIQFVILHYIKVIQSVLK